MKIKKLLGSRILVRRSKTLNKTAGGIVLPDSAKEPPKEGKILKVGTEETKFLEKGQNIMFASYAGIAVDPLDEDLLIMNYTDVLAITK